MFCSSVYVLMSDLFRFIYFCGIQKDVQYEAPFPYVQPRVEEPVPQTDQFQFYTNSYGNYPNYGYDYDYNNQYYNTAQPQSQRPPK